MPYFHTVHDRMPVIIDPDDYDAWLDNKATEAATALGLLVSCVSTRVNQVQTDDADYATPVELEPAPQGQLV
ncbi:MAG TPA: SOS response-associated peptidase family protein [Candidatus Sulfotelmatobacter sp.]|nr:SOS response-associated peptidase family protein [Candidatus Sulfotelmatobacter sp.]